ncbi:MAG: HD domain-containing protein [Candidatus Marsarchaeota archaeon]|nr:HD domain-containing protein [Candidatus Marsarchaeota archaeon]
METVVKNGHKIEEEALRDVRRMLSYAESLGLHYHNIEHTVGVAKEAGRLADIEGIGGSDRTHLTLAALYHDTGMLIRQKGHEEVGAAIARNWLESSQYGNQDIKEVERLIVFGTRMPPNPRDLLEEIICASDHRNICKPEFFSDNIRLKREREALEGRQIPMLEWYAATRDGYLEALLKNERFMHAIRRFGMESGMRENYSKLSTLIEDLALDNLPRYVPRTDSTFGRLSTARRT